MTAITTRNILRMWHSTNPDLVGYAGSRAAAEYALARLLASAPFRGTPRQLVAEIARVRRESAGALCHFTVRTANGREVSIDEIYELIDQPRYRSAYR